MLMMVSQLMEREVVNFISTQWRGDRVMLPNLVVVM